jgi:hypothetical protein
MKTSSTPLVIREMKFRSTMRTMTQLFKIKRLDILGAGEDVGQLELS